MEMLAKIAAIVVVIVVGGVSFVLWNTDQGIVTTTTPNDFVGDNDNPNNKKIVALASFYPLYEFTKAIGGDKVDVSLLVRTGVEPHDWDPSIHDIQTMQNADLIVINGIGFESWVDKFIQTSTNSDTVIVDTSHNIEILYGDDPHADENAGDPHADENAGDPHIWLNPVLAKTQVKNILNSLQELDPSNALYYEDNAQKYIDRLDSLDNLIENTLHTCNKDFIVYHNAFSYFANQYGLNQHPIIRAYDPHDAEPTSKTLQNIIELAHQLNIDVIFTEENSNSKILDVISKETGSSVLVLSPIEIAGPDNSGYIDQMKQNLVNLEKALC